MKRCKVCRKKPGIERRVDCDGIVFCSDDCYEKFDNSPNDNDHPYIDDYDAVRFEYIEWMKNYENDLYGNIIFGTPKKADLLEGIESVIDEFGDYYSLEGNDGIFSEEIYHYLLALEELHSLIENWQPDEKELKKRRKARK
ncbi:hypothetical protein [Bacillus massilinigeriensis]|uniref:hypothetical protein n=1 Tax=Bacillus massilionigeriensis TaxID=1805475 RepID=UPI00096B2C1B|nr:hypothetical protein [Bacillus massilionigeriensis]